MESPSSNWVILHDQTEAKVVELNGLVDLTHSTPRIKRDIRNAVSIINGNLKTLHDDLERTKADKSPSAVEEHIRRQTMLEALRVRAVFTQDKQRPQQPSMDPHSVYVPVEVPETAASTNTELVQHQEDEFKQQDGKLDDILNGVGRLRTMGEDINSELLLHAELLSDLDRGVDDTHRGLVQGTNRAKYLMNKDSSCTGMFVIFLLLIVIVVLLVM